MTDDEVRSDPYTELGQIGQAGENSFTFAEDGSITMKRKLPEEHSTKLRGAARIAVERCPDSMIERMVVTGLGIYYRIGKKVSVRGGDGGHWLCLTCSGPDRYELGEHRGCAHIQRVKLWASDHPTEAAA